MAPILTIFGPIESQRHDLFLKFSNERNERKVFEKFFVVVAAIIVVSRFGEIKIGNLKEGEFRYLNENEIKGLRKFF